MSSEESLPEVLSDVLEKVRAKRTKTGWQGFCPAHDDRHPSLSIAYKEDKILLYCFAGCSFDDIIQALGIKAGSLRNGFAPGRSSETCVTYIYHDSEGRPYIGKRKYPGKVYQIVHYLDGKWRPGLGGFKPLPYRLPDILKVAQNGGVLVICEGEKDADRVNLWAQQEGILGDKMVATTPLNSGKWELEWNSFLEGIERIDVIRDRDEAGHKYAQMIIRNLPSVRTRLLEPLVGKDAYDHLETYGQSYSDFVFVREFMPGLWKEENVPVLTPFSEIEVADVKWLLFPYLPLGAFVLLEGNPGVGKSMLALKLASDLSRGESTVLGKWELESASSVFLSYEDAPAIIAKRLEGFGAELSKIFLLEGIEFSDRNAQAMYDFENILREVRPKLVVLDPLFGYLRGDHYSDVFARTIVKGFADIARRLDCVILGIRHLTKQSSKEVHHETTDNAVLQGLGSVGFYASARSVLCLVRSAGDNSSLLLRHLKSSYSAVAEDKVLAFPF